MNGYICTKACTFGGVAYSVGDAIPSAAVLPSRERALIKQGFIALAADTESLLEQNKSLKAQVEALKETAARATEPPQIRENEPEGIVIPITAKGGVLELVATPDDIVKAVATMQLNAEEAAKAVGEIETEEALILIDALDQRKTVKTAIAERIKEIQSEVEGGTEEDEGQGDA
jgi:hypothetical protein